jgi:hypothetical protein
MDKAYISFCRRPWPALLFARKEALAGGPLLRLPLVAIAVFSAGLGLGSGDAHAGRYLPTIENPYCPITTYTLRDVAEQASSMKDSNGRPVIVVNLRTLRDDPAYAKFLMAHECCHHSLGHVGRFKQGLGQVGPQPFFYIAPSLKRMELEADCCAARLLRERHEEDGIEAGRRAMTMFGAEPTGAYYPTGIERADNISGCALMHE